MLKSEKIKFLEVEKAFRQIQYVLAPLSWGQYGREYYNLNLQESKAWNANKPGDAKRGLSVLEESKLFFVHWLIYYSKNKKPTLKETLHLKPSAVRGAVLVENFPDEIAKALRGEAIPGTPEKIDIEIIESLDFAELVKPDNEK